MGISDTFKIIFVYFFVETTVHLVSVHTRCFCYLQKTGSPSHNFFTVKNFPKV